jgi:hypothetical protein
MLTKNRIYIKVLVIGVAMVFSFSLFAQDIAHIDFKETTFDYGEIPLKGNGECTFTFSNTGKGPLVINEVTTSCGCTAVEWPQKPILSGESADIIIKYDTKREGTFNKSIIIKSNADNTPVNLEIKGTVLKKE